MEKAGFQNLVDKLSTVATLDKWEPLYDKQLDFFYWRKPKLSKDFKMVKISNETHLYLSPKGDIEGVLVEYLTGNFVAHNKEYRGMVEFFDKKIDSNRYTVSKRGRKSRETEVLFDKFTESLRADIYKDACQNRRTLDDLNFVIAQALSS